MWVLSCGETQGTRHEDLWQFASCFVSSCWCKILPFKQKMPLYFISSYFYCANRVTNCSTAVCLQGFSKEALSGRGMFYLRSWIEFFKEVWSSSYSRTRKLSRVLVLPAKKKRVYVFFPLHFGLHALHIVIVITCGSSLLLANRVFPFFMLGKADGVTGLAFLSYSLQSVTLFIIMKRSQK